MFLVNIWKKKEERVDFIKFHCHNLLELTAAWNQSPLRYEPWTEALWFEFAPLICLITEITLIIVYIFEFESTIAY